MTVSLALGGRIQTCIVPESFAYACRLLSEALLDVPQFDGAPVVGLILLEYSSWSLLRV